MSLVLKNVTQTFMDAYVLLLLHCVREDLGDKSLMAGRRRQQLFWVRQENVEIRMKNGRTWTRFHLSEMNNEYSCSGRNPVDCGDQRCTLSLYNTVLQYPAVSTIETAEQGWTSVQECSR
jgi:hypothetical protein